MRAHRVEAVEYLLDAREGAVDGGEAEDDLVERHELCLLVRPRRLLLLHLLQRLDDAARHTRIPQSERETESARGRERANRRSMAVLDTCGVVERFERDPHRPIDATLVVRLNDHSLKRTTLSAECLRSAGRLKPVQRAS